MQLAAYAQVSTQRQVQEQTTEWEHVFRYDGHSGASLQCPGLDRLRDAAASACLDRVLITAPNRLARNYVHQVLLVEELQKHGTVVDFLDRPMSGDPHGQVLLQMRGAVAEYERTLITERIRRGRLRKLRAGTLLPWTLPLIAIGSIPNGREVAIAANVLNHMLELGQPEYVRIA